MPPATRCHRGQAKHDSLPHFHYAASPPAAAAHSKSKGLYRISNLTPRITRPPKPLPDDNNPRVAGRVHAPVRLRHLERPPRRPRRDQQHGRPAMPPGSHDPRGQAVHNGRHRFDLAPPAPAAAARPSSRILRSPQQSNARHHPPPQAMAEFDGPRVGGRVHAAVRPPTSAGMKRPSSQPGAFKAT
jgi:hypothetical protein